MDVLYLIFVYYILFGVICYYVIPNWWEFIYIHPWKKLTTLWSK